MHFRTPLRILLSILLAGIFFWVAVQGADWPSWRGPLQKGVSPESGLVSDWSLQGDNLIWRADFVGRSTPIVMNGRVYVMGRVGEGIDKQERVACYDARDGALLWEHRFNVFLTTVPFPRVGWANVTGDPETGNILVHGVAGQFFCFDGDGKILWERSLGEEFGEMSGYGGRTHTPVVDGDLVILGSINSGWGEQAPPRHRYFAFDKHTGTLVWISTPGGAPHDLNTYSTPVVAEIDGQRLLIAGDADGSIYALKVQTGEKVWGFQLSKRGINTSVVVEGKRVYATHGEENVDEATMGRVVCIDATGTGDVTRTHEVWRYNEFLAGFVSPALHEGLLYVIDNAANLHCLDALTGRLRWKYNLGTIAKASPVWADGKLYVPEANGAFYILKPSPEGVELLDREVISLGNRGAEIHGSPAVAYKRVFFVTEEGLYCLGNKNEPFQLTASQPAPAPKAPTPSTPAHLQVVPAEVLIWQDETVSFQARSYDAQGISLGTVQAQWSLQGLSGEIDSSGKFRPQPSTSAQTGIVHAEANGLSSSARVRVMPALPWQEDFEGVEKGKFPAHWIGAANRFFVRNQHGNKVLSKPFVSRGIQRSYVMIGPPDMNNYTVQVDLMGTREGRRVPDMGVIANRYVLALVGSRQELQVNCWPSELRMAQSVPFAWEPGVWYTMKMRVDLEGGKAVIRGKVWPRSEEEPEAWSLVAEDPYPNKEGAPGIYGQSYAEIFYDNLKVSKSTP